MTQKDQQNAIYHKVAELVPLKDAAYFNTMRALSAIGVEHVKMSSLKPEEENYLRAFFNSEIRPIISPQVVDKRHPFPFLKNKDIYAITHLESKNSVKLGLRFVLAEEVILRYCNSVFENYRIIDKALIRITRNADINMEEALYDHDVDLRQVMEELLKKRKKLSPVRLEIYGCLNNEAEKFLCHNLELHEHQISR